MPVVDKGLKLRTNSHIGDVFHGAPGGYRGSHMFVLSYAVADELARELGIAAEEAHRTVIAFGKVAQKLLLKGTPVGIPHIGTLILHQQRRTMNPKAIIKSLAARGITANIPNEVRTIIHKKVALKMPTPLRRMFMDNALYSGSIKTHKAAATEKLKTKLGTNKGGAINHRAGKAQ
jgi:hypothetical protein